MHTSLSTCTETQSRHRRTINTHRQTGTDGEPNAVERMVLFRIGALSEIEPTGFIPHLKPELGRSDDFIPYSGSCCFRFAIPAEAFTSTAA